MAIMLPPELSKFLNYCGFEWPEGNEDRVFDWGGLWQDYGGQVDGVHATADGAAQHVIRANEGAAVKAFQESMTKENSLDDVGKNLAVAGTITGGCLFVIAAAIVALKIAFVVNLTIFAINLASAIAAAIPTAGASMSVVPLLQLVLSRAIQFAISMAIEQLLGA